MILAAVLCLVGIAGLNYLWFRDLLYPPVLVASVWATAVAVAGWLAALYDYEFSPSTLVLVLAGPVAFSVGSLIVSRAPRYNRQLCSRSGYEVDRKVKNIPSRLAGQILLGIAVLVLPFYLRQALNLAASGPMPSWFMNLRYGVVYGAGYGWTAYGVTFAYGALLVAQIRRLTLRTTYDNYVVWIALGVALCYGIFSTARTSLLQSALFYLMPMVVMRMSRLRRIVPLSVVVSFIVFGAYAVLLRKGVSVGADGMELFAQVAEGIGVYLAGGIFGLDSLVRGDVTLVWGDNTLRFLYAVMERLGFPIEQSEAAKGFITYPVTTNVYTFYRFYLQDLGWWYPVVVQFILGLLYGYVYSGIRKSTLRAFNIFAYSILAYPLLMQVFEDQYLSLVSVYLQYLLIWIVVIRWMGERVTTDMQGTGRSNSVICKLNMREV